ncbi:TPA: Hin recombinase, partial [Enterobacter cloacae]|nr:Hin recombinase [Enterobacter cloacae]
RKPKYTDEHWDAFEREIKSGCSHRDIALKYGVGLSTLYKRYPAQQEHH